jgi:hypothetical protein
VRETIKGNRIPLLSKAAGGGRLRRRREPRSGVPCRIVGVAE